VKRDFEEIIQQRRGVESFEKKNFEDGESVLSLEQIKIITELLEKAPRSTVINFGATEELVGVVEKAAVIMNQMHEMAFGKKQREDKLEEMLLKVFREINVKVNDISERLERFEETPLRDNKKLINLSEKKPSTETREAQKAADKMSAQVSEPEPKVQKVEEVPARKSVALSSEGENEKVLIKGFAFEGIPYTVSDKGVAAFAWKKADDQEEALKKALMQLQDQGVDTTNTFALKEAGFETIYTKFRNLNLANKNWRQWISSWQEG
jgi:hypothetical protein